MNKRVAMAMMIAAALLILPAAAGAALIWDANTGTTGVQEGDGTWGNGGTNWWNAALSTNVPWDNANPDVAQFGNAVAAQTTAHAITVDGTVKSTGLTLNRRFNFLPHAANGGIIELNGGVVTIPVYSVERFYTSLTTAAGLEKIVIRGNGTKTDEYVYLHNANDFDAPIEIGEAEGCAVFVGAGTAITTPVELPGSTAGLGGDPTKSITVFNGSTLGIRSNTVTDKNIILKGGTGYGNRGNLEFYSPAWSPDLQGSVTLEGDTSILTRANGKISGSLTGDYNLQIVSSASNAPGSVTLTNAVNSSNSLTVSSQTQATIATGHLILAGNYVADEYVTLNKYGDATIRNGATLTSPVVNVNAGGTLRGVGSVLADVIVAVDGAIEGGEIDIINPSPDPDVYYLDVDTSIGALAVTGDVTLGGTMDVEYDSAAGTIDMVSVSGQLDLTGGTLNFSDLAAGTLSGAPRVFATYGSLVGAPAAVTGVPDGWQIAYHFGGNSIALVPEPAALALLATLATMALAGWRARR